MRSRSRSLSRRRKCMLLRGGIICGIHIYIHVIMITEFISFAITDWRRLLSV